MIIEISIDLFGDNFSPKKFLDCIENDFEIISSVEPNDANECDKSGVYGFGSISILNPMKYGVGSEQLKYENWYIDFIEKNYSLFIDNGVTDIRLFWNVYYFNQCNFEIFDKDMLQNLSKYLISIPVSVYRLSESEIIEMINESGYDNEQKMILIKNL
jgi:hypothetical protein